MPFKIDWHSSSFYSIIEMKRGESVNKRYEEIQKWEIMNYILLKCGNENEPRDFAVTLLIELEKLELYDKALVFFLDGNGKVCDQYRKNIDARWSNAYLEYYVHTSEQKYSCFRDIHERPDQINLHIRYWNKEKSSEFLKEYITPLGISCSCGFAFYDMNKNVRAIIAMDKQKGKEFSKQDLEVLRMLLPHLNNLYKNYFYEGFHMDTIKRATLKTSCLTEREVQITNLLCQGVSQVNISRMLHISRSTTYSHMAHIYEKLHVSSQQELISLLLHNSK